MKTARPRKPAQGVASRAGAGPENGNIFYDTMDSPLGAITVTVDDRGRIVAIDFSKKSGIRGSGAPVRDPAKCKAVLEAIDEFLKGKRSSFNIATSMRNGTEFQRKVWNALLEIPFGETRSYKEIAERIGKPLAARAVGNAAGANPIPIVIPCHRLVASHGKLGGYSGGIEKKKMLLGIEKGKKK